MARTPPAFQDHPARYADASDHGLNRATCRYVVDGDTADFFVDLGWLQYAYVTVRFFGVDTPELRGTDGAEREAAVAARSRVELLLLNRPVLLRSYRDKTTFGRFVATVWFATTDEAFFELPDTFRLREGDAHQWVSIAEVLKAEGLIKGVFRQRDDDASPRV